MRYQYLFDAYYRQVESAFRNKKLSETCYERLKSRTFEELEDLDEPMKDFIHSMENAEYYLLLDRIEKGEAMVQNETNQMQRAEYQKLLNELTAQLDGLTLKEVAA